MGRMKDLHITIHNGGDEAVAAVERMGKDWREQLEQAASEIERTRLTDAERAAVAFMMRHAAVAADGWAFHDSVDYQKHHDAVFALLDRTERRS